MSHYVTPFLVLNLGSEMVFVVAQRLQAQNICSERTNIDEIISVLISKQLITELMKPQATYNHEAIRDIIEDVTQSSMMRLDTTSMGKLWDLITMVLKWQSTISDDIIKLTLRHLYELETYTTNPETQLQLQKVQNLVDGFKKILSPGEKVELREDILYWLKDNNVRVSLLLRMGLQTMEGVFVTENLDPLAEQMLRNLGENIYAATDNGRVLEKSCVKQERTVDELKLFVDQMIGDRKKSGGETSLRLSIDGQNGNSSSSVFDTIEVSTQQGHVEKLISEMYVVDKEEGNNLTDDLLQMLDNE